MRQNIITMYHSPTLGITAICEVIEGGVRVKRQDIFLPERTAADFAARINVLRINGLCTVRPFTAGIGWVAEGDAK